MIKCLFCGADARVCRAGSDTEEGRQAVLVALVGKGFSADALAFEPTCVESLDVTSPGFVPWLRALLGRTGDAV